MEIGNRILELRKQHNLSQEQLAEKIGVARQTISKWELGETSPDIDQTKKLSKLFNVTVDSLINNNLNDIVYKKVSRIEKVTGIIVNILKITFFLVVITIIVLLFITWCREYFAAKPVGTIQSIECIIDGKEYTYEIEDDFATSNSIDSFRTNDKELNINYKDYDKIEWLIDDIKDNVISRGGTCNNNLK